MFLQRYDAIYLDWQLFNHSLIYFLNHIIDVVNNFRY